VTYNAVIDLAKQYHRVPTTVVLNPSTGPGTVVDGNYTAAIKRLQGAGCTVLGYVHATYATRASADVRDDVDTWIELYPLVDGIFIDEMTNDDDASHRFYFSGLTSYIHGRDLFPVVGNPGSGLGYAYFSENCADVIVIYEGDGYPGEATFKGDFDGGYADVSYQRRAALLYNVTQQDSGAPNFLSTTELKELVRHTGMVYLTNDNAPNPWDVFDPLEFEGIYFELKDQGG